MLAIFSAFAADVKDAPPPATDVVGITIFLILFIGMVVGFFVYLWWTPKQGKEE